ncbi:VPLPA-CTERM sorting domain-containing protein [uncultured Thiocystis sp.]|uniref:VPLPA-CTERM sorting domain-containing protein n=1 Tax=uncultured Thiocystis sp. TaxID=1202134 RepID=UPI0025E8454F|nr:VPLPA-CTERM sorting domain-containing protein [uncultured Thiocystis sp.]
MNKLMTSLAISAMIDLFCVSGMASAASVNHVVNGDFEVDSPAHHDGKWQVYKEGITGWTTTTGPGIEVQRGDIGGSPAYTGVQKVELDSHGNFNNANSGMSQKILLEAGSYLLSFAYFGRTGDIDTNGINYRFAGTGINENKVNTVSGVFDDGWKVFNFNFTLNDRTTISLFFEATGKSDTLGGYLDAVSVTGVPIPPAVWLFGSALMGLVGIARRQTAKV